MAPAPSRSGDVAKLETNASHQTKRGAILSTKAALQDSMKKRIYIETTIPSFYYEVRNGPEIIARRQWTREWWGKQREHYELVTSLAVIEELKKDNYLMKSKTLSDVPILPIEDAIADIVEAYIVHRVMPNDPVGDALHLAMASFHLRGDVKMKKDYTIERIRAIRHQISAEYNHDPRQLVAHYREVERKYEGRIFKDKPTKAKSPDSVFATLW